MNILQTLQTLVKHKKTGQEQYLSIWAGEEDGVAFTQSASWSQTANGVSKKIVSAKAEVLGKNIGKANETQPMEQALLEAESKWVKKQAKGYWVYGQEEPVRNPLPMLAEKWEAFGDAIEYPVYAQPKLDGARCLMKDGGAWTRELKPFAPGVLDHLLCSTNGLILDGELMAPSGVLFEEFSSSMKRAQEGSVSLAYHVYDIVDESLSFVERQATLKAFFEQEAPVGFVLVETTVVNSAGEADEKFNEMVEAGYEGTMYRTNEPYLIQYRDRRLIKRKPWMQEEFEIVDVQDGVGKNKGAALLVCRLPNGGTFRTQIEAPIEVKQKIFQEKQEVIGKMATVKFQEWTKKGSVRFQTALGVRDYE